MTRLIRTKGSELPKTTFSLSLCLALSRDVTRWITSPCQNSFPATFAQDIIIFMETRINFQKLAHFSLKISHNFPKI